MDSEIEEIVKSCSSCQATRPSPPVAQLHPWEWPNKPWSRLHIDFAGPFMGHMYLVVVDAHSKWIEAVVMKSISSAKTIERLRAIFATHGLPQKIVSDNGLSFTSDEFKKFMQANGIRHITSAPYHPSTNGLAERAVQTVKNGLRQMEGETVEEKLSRFLMKYRITPHSTTGISPSQLLMGRRLRTRLDLLHPDLANSVENRQWKQKQGHNNSKPERTFKEGDQVYAEDFSTSSEKWIPGVVKKVTGPVSYRIQLSDGREIRRHVDSVRSRSERAGSETPIGIDTSEGWEQHIPSVQPASDNAEQPPPPAGNAHETLPTTTITTASTTRPPDTRRSEHHRQPPDYFNPANY